MSKKKVLVVIVGRYYPEYNGQAKIFHESARRIVKNNLAEIDVIRFRYDGKNIKEYSQDDIFVRTINLPFQPKGIYLLLGTFVFVIIS